MIDDRKLIACSRRLAKVIFASSVFLCLSGNAVAALVINKTIPAPPVTAAEGDAIQYNLSVTNTGPGVLNNVIITDSPSNLSGLNFTVTSPSPPPNNSGPGVNQYRFNNLADGETVTLDLDATVTASDTCPVINNSASVTGTENSSNFTANDAALSIEYDFGFTRHNNS